MKENRLDRFLPLSEATYYILLALWEPRHGYGIMQHTAGLTGQRLKIGPGTLYGTIGKLLTGRFIAPHQDQQPGTERRKLYVLTAQGRDLLRAEYRRLENQVKNGSRVFKGDRWRNEP